MNTPAVVLFSVVLSAAAATGVSFALRPGDPPPDTTVPDMQRAIADLRTENAALQKNLDELRKAPAPVSAPASVDRAEAATVSPEQVAAAVETYLRKRGTVVASDAAASDPAKAFDLDGEFGKLQKKSFFEDASLWKRLFAAGKIDEAIAKFEALAAANPTDTKAQMELANAYLSYLQLDPAKYDLAMKADRAFDKVLAIDEKHWDARFSKAMSYSFWPEFTGKPKEAITQFEKLIEQQESMPVEENHAEAYLFLGNLLEAKGNSAKAKQVWKKGARRHPENQELAQKAGS